MIHMFIRQDTGERMAFVEDGYTIDTTNQHSGSVRDFSHVSCLRANGGYRIDRCPDGVYRDKWNVVWLPESTHS
jgi:hypothetical protein